MWFEQARSWTWHWKRECWSRQMFRTRWQRSEGCRATLEGTSRLNKCSLLRIHTPSVSGRLWKRTKSLTLIFLRSNGQRTVETWAFHLSNPIKIKKCFFIWNYCKKIDLNMFYYFKLRLKQLCLKFSKNTTNPDNYSHLLKPNGWCIVSGHSLK